MRVGILSDTHGLLRDEVLEILADSDLLLHAGDVGDMSVLERLREVARVLAVSGNTDSGATAALPAAIDTDLGGLPVRMTHRREDVPTHWAKEARLVVFGHSHRPELEWHGRCLFLNPGACGHRRFDLPLTVARVTVREERLVPEILGIGLG